MKFRSLERERDIHIYWSLWLREREISEVSGLERKRLWVRVLEREISGVRFLHRKTYR